MDFTNHRAHKQRLISKICSTGIGIWILLVCMMMNAGAQSSEQAETAYLDGRKQFAANRYDTAIARFSQALMIDPSYKLAYIGRASAETALLSYDKAFEDYKAALKIDPYFSDAYFSRGTLYWLLGQLHDAEHDYRRVSELQPDDPFIYNRLATVLYEEHQKGAVRHLYEHAYEKDRSRGWALWGLLGAISASSDFGELERKIAQLQPDDSPAANYYAGMVFLHKKDYLSASSKLNHLIDIDPDNIPLDAYSYLAESYRRQGNTEKFKKYLLEYFDRTGTDFPGLSAHGLHDNAYRALREVLLDGHSIDEIAFSSDSFVIIYDQYGFWAWNAPKNLLDVLYQLNRDHEEILNVAFRPSGGWALISRRHYWYFNIPDELQSKLAEIANGRDELRRVSFTSDGGWIILFGSNGYWQRGITEQAQDELRKLNSARETIRSISFTENDSFAILANPPNNWKTFMADKDMPERLHDLSDKVKTSIDIVTFTPEGGWVIYSKDTASRYYESLKGQN